MTTMSHTSKERYYFEKFCIERNLVGERYEYGDKPDVILYKEDKRIGIDLTHFYKKCGRDPQSEQVQRYIRKKVTDSARHIYLRDNGRDFRLLLTFNEQCPIRDQKKLVSAIVALATAVEDYENGPVQFDPDDIPELTSAWLVANGIDYARWGESQVFDVPLMSASRLVSIVHAKEGQLNGYTACDAYWLLIIIDMMDAGQDQDIQISGIAKCASEMFEKCILFKPQLSEIIELARK
jgi:hypothetical protein